MSSNNSTVSLSATLDSFADLPVRSSTHDALRRMNISTPTKIQADTLPVLLSGRDVIGQSRTGSGKTLAFGIPAVESVDAQIKTVQVLVLTPTRELAVQVGDVLAQLTEGTGIKVALVYGGRSIGPQISEIRRGAQIVVGTPGRVADLYGQRALPLNNVRFLVLDEADEMLDRGFLPQVNQILSWTPSTRQTALFSATMPDWVNDASRRHLRNPQIVSVESTHAESGSIDHIAYDVPTGGKLDALKDLLDARGDGQVIVFGRTKHGVRKLAKQMAMAGYPVAALQGNLSQNARDAVMADFRAGKVPVLLATNVAARGIDVTAVDYVINFELPESADLLSHRIGRTGRMGRSGQAITLLGDEDSAKWRQLERGLGKRIPRQAWTGARRTDSHPVVVEHASTERRPSQRPTTSRASSAGNERRDNNRTPQRDSRGGNRPTESYAASPNERPTDTRRDGNRNDRPSEPAAPIQRRRSSISIVSQMINEQHGVAETAPAQAPAREQRQHTSRPNDPGRTHPAMATDEDHVAPSRKTIRVGQPGVHARLNEQKRRRIRPSHSEATIVAETATFVANPQAKHREATGAINRDLPKQPPRNRPWERHTATCSSCDRRRRSGLLPISRARSIATSASASGARTTADPPPAPF